MIAPTLRFCKSLKSRRSFVWILLQKLKIRNNWLKVTTVVLLGSLESEPTTLTTVTPSRLSKLLSCRGTWFFPIILSCVTTNPYFGPAGMNFVSKIILKPFQFSLPKSVSCQASVFFLACRLPWQIRIEKGVLLLSYNVYSNMLIFFRLIGLKCKCPAW